MISANLAGLSMISLTANAGRENPIAMDTLQATLQQTQLDYLLVQD
ncbi:exported hypothetical protein [Xenorhabdus cabanillasii JM26]|nr:exported hypothetical protein [Xenorhabdus cabanillasii JM26]